MVAFYQTQIVEIEQLPDEVLACRAAGFHSFRDPAIEEHRDKLGRITLVKQPLCSAGCGVRRVTEVRDDGVPIDGLHEYDYPKVYRVLGATREDFIREQTRRYRERQDRIRVRIVR